MRLNRYIGNSDLFRHSSLFDHPRYPFNPWFFLLLISVHSCPLAREGFRSLWLLRNTRGADGVFESEVE
jgi:hypothetical protein